MQRIYLDANATTPVLPDVVDAMRPYFTERFGNPSSAHASGQHARSAVEHARAAVASLLHCTAKEIVFTSGGTEGDNLALRGILEPLLETSRTTGDVEGTTPHLITTQIEHHAVLYTAQALEARGVEVTYLAPTPDGTIDPAAFEAALRPNTRLVSVMLANNETGAIQPLGKLARIAKAHGNVLVHTDAVQAAGKLPLNLGDASGGEFKNVDLLTISGHKMYAPQGTGALFVRKGVQLAPIFHGGPHERQRRAGTENVPGIVALGRAAELAYQWLVSSSTNQPATPVVSTEVSTLPPVTSTGASTLPPVISTGAQRSGETPVFAPAHAPGSPIHPAGSSGPTQLTTLRDRLEQGLLAAIPGAHINAAQAPRTPNTLNIRFEGIDAEALLIALDLQGISASFGAACQSGATEPSHVLLAMGLTAAQARASLRLSLSRLTTGEEIDRVLAIIPAAVSRLRTLRQA